MKFLAGLFLIAGVLLCGHIEYQDRLMEQASYTCRNQDSGTVPTKEQCIDNQLR